eukprot:scaffold28486_cov55-Phaeocystis_antarctica.AAC.3
MYGVGPSSTHTRLATYPGTHSPLAVVAPCYRLPHLRVRAHFRACLDRAQAEAAAQRDESLHPALEALGEGRRSLFEAARGARGRGRRVVLVSVDPGVNKELITRHWNVAGADRHASSELAAVERLVSFGYRGQVLHALVAASLLETILAAHHGRPHAPQAVPATRRRPASATHVAVFQGSSRGFAGAFRGGARGSGC